jgi:16S rRNA processing protein RimM
VGPAGREELVVIAHLGRAHGVSGEIAARPTGPTLGALEPGAPVVVRGREGAERAVRLAGRRGDPARPILAFEGVETREQAAPLAGGVLLVGPEVLPPLDDPDTLYVRELIGYRVLAGERALGAVTQVHAGPANDALEVASEDGPLLIPFTADAVLELDRPGRRVVIRADLLGDG